MSQPSGKKELYYMENGLVVFTEAYHLKRGYCCNSGCRHCPYPKEEQVSDKKISSTKKSSLPGGQR